VAGRVKADCAANLMEHSYALNGARFALVARGPHCDAILRFASSALRPWNVSGKGHFRALTRLQKPLFRHCFFRQRGAIGLMRIDPASNILIRRERVEFFQIPGRMAIGRGTPDPGYQREGRGTKSWPPPDDRVPIAPPPPKPARNGGIPLGAPVNGERRREVETRATQKNRQRAVNGGEKPGKFAAWASITTRHGRPGGDGRGVVAGAAVAFRRRG